MGWALGPHPGRGTATEGDKKEETCLPWRCPLTCRPCLRGHGASLCGCGAHVGFSMCPVSLEVRSAWSGTSGLSRLGPVLLLDKPLLGGYVLS